MHRPLVMGERALQPICFQRPQFYRAVRADAHDRVRRLAEGADRRRVHTAHLREGPLGLEVGRGQAAGHDLNYLSLAGVLNLLGEPDRRPAIPLNIVADYAGASLHGVMGIMFALYARERTGKGQHVDVSYLDTTIALLAATPNVRDYFADGTVPGRGLGVFGGNYAYYGVYETKDGKSLSIACTEPWLWENFCDAVGRPHLKSCAMLLTKSVTDLAGV